MPTLKDLIKRHEERFMEDIKEEINKNEHTKELNLINILMSEDYSPIDIAACLLKHYNENNKLNNHEELIDVDIKKNKKKGNDKTSISNKGGKSNVTEKNSRIRLPRRQMDLSQHLFLSRHADLPMPTH